MSRDLLRLADAVRDVKLVELEGDALDAIVERVREQARAEGTALAIERQAGLLDQAAERLDAFRDEAASDLARTSVQLALEIARRLLWREVPQGNYDLEGIVRETLREAATGRGRCIVHLHPDDCEALADARFRTGTTIQADNGVARGDVHVETSLGLMVRELEGALESIGRRIEEELH